MVEVKYRMKVPQELLPMTFGSPLRNPHYDWKSWGIEYDGKSFEELNSEAEDAYNDEWSAKGKVELVSKAAKQAGFGDNAQIVRDAAATPVAYLVSQREGDVYVFFVGTGAGLDAVDVFNSLDENDKNRVKFTLLDPSRKELDKATEAMEKLGVSYKPPIHSTDINLPEVASSYLFGFESQDIVVGAASMHHHALIPWDLYRDMLRKEGDGGGYIVISDWHVNNLWTPEGVYAMLTSMKWERDLECFKAWEDAYGISSTKEAISSLSPADIDMIRFWKGYHDILMQEEETENAIWPNEGHRSKEKYMTELAQVGFKLWTPEIENLVSQGLEVNGKKIETNPHQILDSSELLMLTVGKK